MRSRVWAMAVLAASVVPWSAPQRGCGQSLQPTPAAARPVTAAAGAGSAEIQEGKLDVNTASAAELLALPGMGRVYAQRIVNGRPYSAKNQLLTRGVLPPAAYEAIRDRIVAHHLRRDSQH